MKLRTNQIKIQDKNKSLIDIQRQDLLLKTSFPNAEIYDHYHTLGLDYLDSPSIDTLKNKLRDIAKTCKFLKKRHQYLNPNLKEHMT